MDHERQPGPAERRAASNASADRGSVLHSWDEFGLEDLPTIQKSPHHEAVPARCHCMVLIEPHPPAARPHHRGDYPRGVTPHTPPSDPPIGETERPGPVPLVKPHGDSGYGPVYPPSHPSGGERCDADAVDPADSHQTSLC